MIFVFDLGAVASASLEDAVNKIKRYLIAFFFDDFVFDLGAVASASLADAVNKTKHFALYLVAFYLDEVCFGFLL